MHILLIFTEKSSPPTLGPVSRVKEKKPHGGTSDFWIHVYTSQSTLRIQNFKIGQREHLEKMATFHYKYTQLYEIYPQIYNTPPISGKNGHSKVFLKYFFTCKKGKVH